MTLLSNPAVAALSAIFVWWFSTGIILYIVGLGRWTFRWSALAACTLFAASLWGLAGSSADPSVAGAYLAFMWAIALWGALEIGFLLGLLTGPRSEPCPDGCSGWRRVAYAVQAILYHELALVVSGAAVVAVTWDGANQIGVWTLAVLWAMRLSAKLNLFLGVPILNDQFLPSHLQYLTSFFTRGRLNFLFPVVITGSTIITAALVARALGIRRVSLRCRRLHPPRHADGAGRRGALVHGVAAAGRTALELGHAFAHGFADPRCVTAA